MTHTAGRFGFGPLVFPGSGGGFPSAINQVGRATIAVGPPEGVGKGNCPALALESLGPGKDICGAVYVMLGAPDGIEYVGFYKSTDGGQTWTVMSVPQKTFVSLPVVTIDGTRQRQLLSLNIRPDPAGLAHHAGNLVLRGAGSLSVHRFGRGLEFSPQRRRNARRSARVGAKPRRQHALQSATMEGSTATTAASARSTARSALGRFRLSASIPPTRRSCWPAFRTTARSFTGAV